MFLGLFIYWVICLFLRLFLILAVLILHTYVFSFFFKYIYLCKYQVYRWAGHLSITYETIFRRQNHRRRFIHCITFCPECIWRRSLHHHIWHRHIWHHCDVTLPHWYRKELKHPESIERIAHLWGGKHLIAQII